jgi:myo-inositol-1(or 4)-monophosphatase
MWSDIPVGVGERKLRDTAVQVATEAAELVSTARSRAVGEVDTKSSDTDVVTAADRAAERHIRQRLAQLRPGEPMLGEEEGTSGDDASGLCWVVDPIDGTVNYLYGYPWYAVSVAAQVDGVSVAGAVVEPAGGRTWSAVRGEGATLVTGRERVPLRASAADRLDLSLVATGFAYRAERRGRQAAAMARLLGSVRDLRRAGSAALDLCAVAAGWVDGYVEHGLNRWDWAAGALIAEEAGAVVRLPEDPAHTTDGLGRDATFAAAPGVADALRAALVDCGVGTV